MSQRPLPKNDETAAVTQRKVTGTSAAINGRRLPKNDKTATATTSRGKRAVATTNARRLGKNDKPKTAKQHKDTSTGTTLNKRRLDVQSHIHKQGLTKILNPKMTEDPEQKKASTQVKLQKIRKTTAATNATGTVAAAVAAASVKASRHATQDDVCGGCRFTPAGDRPFKTCGFFANEISLQKKVSFTEGIRILVEEQGNKKCSHCLSKSCKKRAKRYWRYDDAAPKLLAAKSHYLPSITEQWRIPALVLTRNTGEGQESDVLSFFSKGENHHPSRRFLFEYNPSIIALPPDQKPDIAGEDPVYLASYRVSTQQNCFPSNVTLAMIGGSWEPDKRPRQFDFLGLAVLRSDLSIIHDAIVNIPMFLGPREDFRLFVLHGQVYVSTYCAMLPLWLTPPSSMEGKKIINGMFPSKLTVTVGTTRTMCSKYWRDIDKSKNLNYFVDSANQTMVEMFPLPHVVYKVDPTGKTDAPNPENATRDDNVPIPSFFTMEEYDLHYRHNFFEEPFTYARGGACCVPFTDPRPPKGRSLAASHGNRELRLGLLHVKTPHGRDKLKKVTLPNHYVSRFYAFEPTTPYKVVAMSGYFCLPADPSKQVLFGSVNNNPYLNIYLDWNNLRVAGESYRCPTIHFVTGMVEKADDPSRLIISYGVNDCTSWFVEVSKAEVIDLLFRPPRIIKKKKVAKLPKRAH